MAGGPLPQKRPYHIQSQPEGGLRVPWECVLQTLPGVHTLHFWRPLVISSRIIPIHISIHISQYNWCFMQAAVNLENVTDDLKGKQHTSCIP